MNGLKWILKASVALLCVCMANAFLVANAQNMEVRTGDLLFFAAEKEGLSGAINAVTKSGNVQQYDHVGILEVDQGKVYIIHATLDKGCVREPLDNVSKKETWHVYRLTKPVSDWAPIIQKAKNYLGMPYNATYVLNDSSVYCSDLVYRAYAGLQIFELQPMTFKNSDGTMNAFWIQHYQQWNMEVPEGLPGCNPNGLARSPGLTFIGIVGK
jgi:hypothetical protein